MITDYKYSGKNKLNSVSIRSSGMWIKKKLTNHRIRIKSVCTALQKV